MQWRSLQSGHQTQMILIDSAERLVCRPSAWMPKSAVLVLASSDERDDIGDALRLSRFATTDADMAIPCPVEGISAVLVSDRLENHEQLCRDWAPHHPVLLVSARRDFAFRISATRAGVSMVVSRPVDPVDLAASLQVAVGGETERLSVVLVDDDILAADIAAEILRASGMDVVVVNDPVHLIDRVEASMPDLILMDLNMPGTTGIELAQAIRLTRRLVAIPILFLSGERSPERQHLARRFGGDDFLLKPIDPRTLVATVRMRGERAKALRAVMERDALTGLLDRGAFHDHLAAVSGLGCHFTLGLLDIDRFKSINDDHGHAVGDRVIQTLAQLLGSDLRERDVIGRCGGEEFGVILLDTDKAAACRVLDRVRERFASLGFEAGLVRFTVSFSAGVAENGDAVATADLFKAADQALYDAKRNGRNQVSVAAA